MNYEHFLMEHIYSVKSHKRSVKDLVDATHNAHRFLSHQWPTKSRGISQSGSHHSWKCQFHQWGYILINNDNGNSPTYICSQPHCLEKWELISTDHSLRSSKAAKWKGKILTGMWQCLTSIFQHSCKSVVMDIREWRQMGKKIGCWWEK